MLDRIRDWRIDPTADRVARRPHGRRSRRVYGADDLHSFVSDLVPFERRAFTAVSSLVAYFFFPDPLAALRGAAGFRDVEVRRPREGAQLLVARP